MLKRHQKKMTGKTQDTMKRFRVCWEIHLVIGTGVIIRVVITNLAITLSCLSTTMQLHCNYMHVVFKDLYLEKIRSMINNIK